MLEQKLMELILMEPMLPELTLPESMMLTPMPPELTRTPVGAVVLLLPAVLIDL